MEYASTAASAERNGESRGPWRALIVVASGLSAAFLLAACSGPARSDDGLRAQEAPAVKFAADSRVLIAAETADADALMHLGDVTKLPVLRAGRYEQHSSRDRGKGLSGMEWLLPILNADNRDMNNFVCKSRDATFVGSHMVEYNFDQEFCPEEYVRGVVLSRHEGSGRLVRLWMTMTSIASAEAAPGVEQLRIYVDDDPSPLIQVPLADVLSGAAGEIFAPPFGAASPNFIAWYYPVVFSRKVIVAIDGLNDAYYFQTDVVLDAEPRERKAAAARLPERDRAIELLRAKSAAPASAARLHHAQLKLAGGGSHELTLSGPATIQATHLSVDKSALSDLANVSVTAHWDGAERAALDLPLLDLFAASRLPVEASNLHLSAAVEAGKQQLALHLPMPFRERAKWRLSNRGKAEVHFELAWHGTGGTPEDDFGYFHVQRNNVSFPASKLEVTVAKAKQRGRYVGMCADVAGHFDLGLTIYASPLNFLEGDFRADVDGRRALDGTGAEDYPDNSFYFQDSPKATPFAQAWGRVSDYFSIPAGQVSYCRWQVLGSEIDFEREFELTHELAQNDPALAALHRTVAFFYMQ